jgi:hypothetical protein
MATKKKIHVAVLVVQSIYFDTKKDRNTREQRGEVSITSAYVSTRQHTSANVSIRQHNVSIRQHTSAYVSIRQHTSAYISIRSVTRT